MSLARTIVLAVAMCVAAPNARVAHACSQGPCWAQTLFPASGAVPSDQARWIYRPARDFRHDGLSPTTGALHAFVVDNGMRTEVALSSDSSDVPTGTFVVFPTRALEPGTTLVLEDKTIGCASGASALSATFEITASTPKPGSLGELSAVLERDLLEIATTAGSCSVEIDAAYADLTLALADDAKPFADVLRYQLRVDDIDAYSFSNSLSGGTPLPRLHERVAAACVPDGSLFSATVLGQHRARLRGELPDGTTIDSSEVTFELKCDEAAADGGVEKADDATPAANSGARDDGGCSVIDAHATGHSWPAALVLLVAARRLKRRLNR